jgi:hypothetical protein
MNITTVARNIDEANDDDKPKSYAEAYCQLAYKGPVFCSLIMTALASLSGVADDYSRLPFSCRLPFRSITDYLTHGNTLIYLYLDLQSESNHLFLHLVFDPICATDTYELACAEATSDDAGVSEIRPELLLSVPDTSALDEEIIGLVEMLLRPDQKLLVTEDYILKIYLFF